jgi:hypothetical protein
MKTVRLPIFEHGVETGELLEVDVEFFLSSTRGLRSTQARVLQEPLANWERELVEGFKEENKAAIEHELELVETSDWGKTEDEWRTLESVGLPTRSFQINQRGQIRHKFNQKIIEPSLDLDSKYYMTVKLLLNGLEYFINGPKLAEEMWSTV